VAEREEETPSAYEEGWQALSARLVWGSEGSGMGEFLAPRGIAVSGDGYVYVADSRNHRIQKFTLEGDYVTEWGGYGECPEEEPGAGEFCEPWDVAVDEEGLVYVADTWADRVQVFTSEGEYVREWTAYGEVGGYDLYGHSQFFGPRGLDVSGDGLVYVADTGHKRVQVFSPAGEYEYEFGGGGSGEGELDEPVGIEVSGGLVYVADTWNQRVQVMEESGEPVLSWGIDGWNNAEVEEKPYLTVDEGGLVYVSDPGHYRILVFDGAGEYVYSFGQFSFGEDGFVLPMGVALDGSGSLYVTDAGSNRVLVFDLP
jgi:DNA-binding beta-propeller fold protein YncE